MLATLDRLGLTEDTLVIFCSDHGEMLGDHGLSQKNAPYEASVRIPFLLRWPGRVPAGGVSDVAVSLLDVFPTLLAETPATLPEGSPPLPGASLLDPAIGERERVAIDFGFDEERWVCLRSPEKKFVFWACGGRVEAYDLAADPDERRNLAELPEPPAWVADWRADLLDLGAGIGAGGAVARRGRLPRLARAPDAARAAGRPGGDQRRPLGGPAAAGSPARG